MEGHLSPTVTYESGNDNIAPPAYTETTKEEVIEYPRFVPRRQIINEFLQQQSALSNKNKPLKKPLLEPSAPQHIIIMPNSDNNISYPKLNKKQVKQPKSVAPLPLADHPPHQDLFCLAVISFFFFPILGLYVLHCSLCTISCVHKTFLTRSIHM
eukprot:261650_1